MENDLWVTEKGGRIRIWLGKQEDREAWLPLRKGRLGSSTAGAAIGQSRFSTPMEEAKRFLGVGKPIELNDAMRIGTLNEPIARRQFEALTGKEVREVGIVYPVDAVYFDPFHPDVAGPTLPAHLVAASPDGFLDEDTLIEIKSPVAVYPKIKMLCEGLTPQQQLTHEHPTQKLRDMIWDSHYAQMHHAMSITLCSVCYYIVFEVSTQTLFIARVPFDKVYWQETLFPGLKTFFDVTVPAAERDHASMLHTRLNELRDRKVFYDDYMQSLVGDDPYNELPLRQKEYIELCSELDELEFQSSL